MPNSDPAGEAHAQHRNRKPFIVFARFCAPNITLRTAQSSQRFLKNKHFAVLIREGAREFLEHKKAA